MLYLRNGNTVDYPYGTIEARARLASRILIFSDFYCVYYFLLSACDVAVSVCVCVYVCSRMCVLCFCVCQLIAPSKPIGLSGHIVIT